jgi:microcystin-dependent protein
MSQPFIGEIRIFAGNFAPQGWSFCEGQVQSISQNNALFALIGTTYGGDGVQTFNLPDLRGRIPVHQGTSNVGVSAVLGQLAGTESVTLSSQNMPIHTHAMSASSSPGHVADPSSAFVAADRDFAAFDGSVPSVAMAATAIGTAGSSVPHDNMPPFLCVSFIISLFGIFPSQN